MCFQCYRIIKKTIVILFVYYLLSFVSLIRKVIKLVVDCFVCMELKYIYTAPRGFDFGEFCPQLKRY